MMLVDTDVFIWYLRGNPRAERALNDLDRVSISAVTYMELVQGMRDKAELRELRATLSAWGARILHVDDAVSTKAVAYVEQHFLAHALRIANALIGATAVMSGLCLLTANAKHYRMLADLTIRVFKP